MKICFVTPFFFPVKGGVENHVLSVSEELIRRGHRVEIITSDSTKEGRLKKREEVYRGIQISRIKTWFHLGRFSPVFPGVFRAVQKSNADIIHVHNYRHLTNIIPLLTKKPCVLTSHWPDYPRGLRNSVLDLSIIFFDKTVGWWLLKKYKKICAVVGPEGRWLEEKLRVPRGRIVVTPNGIPKQALQFQKKKRRKEVIAIAIGRLHKSKGFDQIVHIANGFSSVQFKIIGPDDGFRKILEAQIQKEQVKNIVLLGECTEEVKQHWLKTADFLIHPSHYEAFGISVLEAMAKGTPVIVANTGGLPWVVGNAGLIFRDNDQNDLREKITCFVSNEKMRKAYGIQAFKKAQKLTWEKTVNILEKVYREVQ